MKLTVSTCSLSSFFFFSSWLEGLASLAMYRRCITLHFPLRFLFPLPSLHPLRQSDVSSSAGLTCPLLRLDRAAPEKWSWQQKWVGWDERGGKRVDFNRLRNFPPSIHLASLDLSPVLPPAARFGPLTAFLMGSLFWFLTLRMLEWRNATSMLSVEAALCLL